MGSIALIVNEKLNIKCLIDDPSKVTLFDRNYFLSPVGRALFEGIQELYSKNVEITAEHLVVEGNRRCDQVTPSIVEGLVADQDYSPDSFKTQYFPRLRSDYAKKTLEDSLLRDALIEAESKDALNVDNVRKIMMNMQEMIDIYEGKESKLLNLEQAGSIYTHQLNARATGMSYRVSDAHLNKMLVAGFPPRYMTVIFGATGVGKSAYGMHLANRDINKQTPALYVSLEMDLISSFDRIVGIRLNIPFSSLMPSPDTGMIEPFILEAVEAEMVKIRKNEKFFFTEDDSLSIADVEMLVKEAKRRARSEYLVVYIDLMTMLKDFSGEDAGGYEDAMNRLHEMCRRQKVHIVNIVQANRKADDTRIGSIEQIEYLRPRRNTIKNSQAILERCRNQLSVFRPRYYAEQLFPADPALIDMDDTLEVQCLKQSQGSVGHIIKYLYQGPCFRCIPIMPSAEPHPAAPPPPEPKD